MAFWGEKFKRPDEEDIWAELKQMLTNSDAYKAQKKLKEAQELEAFNKAWDKANGVGAIQPTQSEPYLKYEDLLNPEDVEKYRQNQFLQNQTDTGVTGLASPINQNKPIGQMVNAKVQQVFSQPTNLVNKNANLLQGFGDSISKGLKSISNKNEFSNLGNPQAKAIKNSLMRVNVVKENDADNNGILTGGGADISENKNLSNIITRCYNDYKNYNDPVSAIAYTLGSFLTNFLEMKDADTHGADKYFHARANYDSAQQGPISELVAKIISDVRELSDADRNIREKKYTPEFSQRDIEEDQKANEEGRILGRMFPDIPAYKKLKHRMPNGFPLRYRYK